MSRTNNLIWRRALLALLFALLTALLVRTYIGGVFRVESTSMEPTLHASPERVFVRYSRGFVPGRFELVVFTPSAESAAVVKRVAGLPGESILISGGDLLIEGRRLGAEVPRPEPIPIFDSKFEPIDQAFSVLSVPWNHSADAWRLDARGRREDLRYTRSATDDHLDATGRRIEGVREVNDLRLEGRFVFANTGELTLHVTEEGDTFEFEIEIVAGAPSMLRLLRRSSDGTASVLSERSASATPGQACAVSLENVDNHLVGMLGSLVLCADYEANSPLVGVPDETYRHLKPRAGLAVSGLELDVQWLCLSRDVFYTPAGQLGSGSPVALGPDELFLLGDNSSDSRDSRMFGAVRLTELTGHPNLVVWPPTAMRRLGRLRCLPRAQAAGQ